MNKNAPIGIFDSGLGGLTTLKAVRERFPNEDIVYFGDTLRVPYGNRTKKTIISFVRDDINVLLRYGVKIVLIACNTADAMARTELSGEYDIPIIGVVEAAAKKAVETTENGKIGLISTLATAKSGLYDDIIFRLRPDCKLISEPTPLLVPLIEGGRIERGDRVMGRLLKEYLLPLQEANIDTLILGCTHYPIIAENIADIIPDVRLINSGSAVADSLEELMSKQELATDRTQPGEVRFFVSDYPDHFVITGSRFIGEDLSGKVIKININ